jgi:ketosteroid isomerase-like protein
MASATLNVRSSTDEATILALIEDRHKAHHNKNAAGIAALYISDATTYDLAPPLAHHGINLKEKQAWLDTWDGPIELESRDFNVTVSGDYAFCYGYIQMTGNPRAAGRQISFWMRSTICLHREGDSWKIVHEHTSVPFYMDGTQRPAFDLKP